jgi:cytochrome b561
MQQIFRYHPLLVTLHWLLAFLIIAALFVGYFLLAPMSNSSPEKVRILMVHMSVGMLILVLTIIRCVVRMLTSRPQAATIGYPIGSARAGYALRFLRFNPVDGQ